MNINIFVPWIFKDFLPDYPPIYITLMTEYVYKC